MQNGKIRHTTHIIETKALSILRELLPDEWVQRDIKPDYGIDMQIELFEYENDKCISLGEFVFLQVKGVEKVKVKEIFPFGSTNRQEVKKIETVSFCIDVPLLNLVERMGSAIPVLLVVIDVNTRKAYYICLNDYIRFVLLVQNRKYREQKTVTIYIPVKNLVCDDLHMFSWYAKRAKIYALFQEMFAGIDTLRFLQGTQLVNATHDFVVQIKESDVWRARKYIGLLGQLYSMIQDMLDNDMINFHGNYLIKDVLEKGGDPHTQICYRGMFDEEGITLYERAQEYSCERLLREMELACTIYQTDLRHMKIPTYFYNQIMQ